MEVGVRVYPLLHPRNPRADLWEAPLEPSSKTLTPFLGLAACRVGCVEPWEGNSCNTPTPPSLPTRVGALAGTLCSPTKENTALP